MYGGISMGKYGIVPPSTALECTDIKTDNFELPS